MARMTREDYDNRSFLFSARTADDESTFRFIGFELEPRFNTYTKETIMILYYTRGKFVDERKFDTVKYPILTEEECLKAMEEADMYSVFEWWNVDYDEEVYETTREDFMEKVHNYFLELENEYDY